MIEITDPGDPRIAEYRHLTDAELRRRVETEGGSPGIFIAEGAHAIRRLLGSPYRVRSLLLTAERAAALASDLSRVTAPVYVAGQEVMDAVTGFHIHRGAVAAGERRAVLGPDAVLTTARVVAVLEGLNDHENLGVLFRSAAALGIDGVLLSPTCCDPLYRRSVRVSQGHVLTVPFTVLEPWPDALAAVADAGFSIVALTPAIDAEPIGDVAAELAPRRARVAVLVGSEGPGLSASALAAAHRRVCIPMRPGADSLNVAAAATVAFHRFAAP